MSLQAGAVTGEKHCSPASQERSSSRFGRALRLADSEQYEAVFSSPSLRHATKYAVIIARPNNLSRFRLGLVVAKKNIRAAADRSRIKRLCRECFRQRGSEAAGLDIIMIIRPGYESLDNHIVRKSIDGMIETILQKQKEQ